MEKLRHFRSNVGTENSFDKRSNNFQTIPKSDIKGKMLRPQFKQRRFAAERLLKFKFGNLGKRSINVPYVPLHIYISLFRI